MKGPIQLAAAAFVLICAVSCAAQEKGAWRAANSSAESITGDVAFSETKISINFINFTIAQIRKLQPAEISAAFDADLNAGGAGNLYRLNIPGSQRFVHHNTLCGSDDVQWLATYVESRSLRIAFFSGTQMPVFTPEAFANPTNLCGVHSYVR